MEVVMRAVVIDDDQQFLNIMERALSREGVEVLTLRNSIGTVTNSVRAFDPDVVLVDLNMPHLPGDELIRLMRREVPRAKYVVLSGCEAALVRRAEVNSGADRSLMKSTDIGHIVSLVKALGGE